MSCAARLIGALAIYKPIVWIYWVSHQLHMASNSVCSQNCYLVMWLTNCLSIQYKTVYLTLVMQCSSLNSIISSCLSVVLLFTNLKVTRNIQDNQLVSVFLHKSLADPINVPAAVKSTLVMMPLLDAICSNNDWTRFCCLFCFLGCSI